MDAEPIDSDSSDGGHNFSSSPPPQMSQNDRLSSHHGSESRDSNMMNDDDSLSNAPGSPLNNNSSQMPGGTPPIIGHGLISLNLGAAGAKKKKLEVRDVFNMDDDSEDLAGPKKRKLVPLGEWFLNVVLRLCIL